MTDILIRDGYQVKTRWHGNGAATLWRWADFFSTLEEASKFRDDHKGKTDPQGFKLEIEIFKLERQS